MKVGDLVVVVKPIQCCGIKTGLGVIFTVLELVDARHIGICKNCRASQPSGIFARYSTGHCVHKDRLRVIPPLNELEAEKAVETVNA